MEAKIINFQSVNNHLFYEFKEACIDLINEEIRRKKISVSALGDSLIKFGFHYPIIKVLKKTCLTYPFEYLSVLMVLVGIDIALIKTDKQHTNRNIRNRKKMEKEKLFAPKYFV